MFDPTVLPELTMDVAVIQDSLPFMTPEEQEQMLPYLRGLQRSIDFIERFNS